MKAIGLTGGIGSGKTTIAVILEHMGFPVFYSDREAAKLMDADPSIRTFLNESTGEEMYTSQGLDRKKLATYIFNDPLLLERVNAIVHPLVRLKWEEWTHQQHANLLFNEAAILFETGNYKRFDKLILVTAPLETRIERVLKRDKTGRDQVLKRISNQWTDTEKERLADFVIQNDGTPILAQIENVINKIGTN